MKRLVVYSLSLAVILSLSACSTDKIPGVYRIDIQQGNNVTQEMINKLEPGMSKNQVAFVMGSPLIVDTFHPNRWDYIYSFQPGNGDREQRRITLYFDDEEKLSHLEGNTRVVAREDMTVETRQDSNVVVPLNEKKTGLFSGMLNLIGLGGDDDEEIIEDSDENNDQPAEENAITETGNEPEAATTEQ
jgi:outer membrane protein assembly factor BamE